MHPQSRRDTLLYVSDRVDRSDAFDGLSADHITTRSADSFGTAADVPDAEWVIVDAEVLGTTPPPWFEALSGDVYVLSRSETPAPDWVHAADVPVVTPTLVDLLTSVAAPTDDRLRGVTGPRESTDPTTVGTTVSTPTDSDGDATSVRPGGTSDGDAGQHTGGDRAVEGGGTADDDRSDDHPMKDGRPADVDVLDSLSTVPFPVALLDEDGVILLVNDAWTRFGAENGRDPDETDVGRNYIAVCDQANDTFATAAAKAIRRVVDGESDGDWIEYPCHGKRTRRWFSAGIVPVADAAPVRVAVVHYDISQYKQRINVLDRVLRHNLRNKANIILGHAAALASDRDAETATAATTIGAAARELLSLSEQARRYREVNADDRPTTPIDLVAVVNEVTERLGERYPLAVIETSLPAVAVVRGTQSLSLVVHELVENAIVHNDSDPWVRIEVVRVHEGGDERVSIRVSDDGPGIPEQDRRLLTGGLEEHPIRHGSQLGVWVVSSLVTSLDGNVTVEPRSPRGSVVAATFPSVTVEK
ncbi:sensor histidine kinase [Salinigranum salinum]|uniref:sensor histidine kinase n=1 Tax=Salinigranum salinum TaxID=1364937 RepID=UPI0012606034|nr:PAS domain-containing sensor histidine kinase [Salinigranum salinum]